MCIFKIDNAVTDIVCGFGKVNIGVPRINMVKALFLE